MEYSATKLSTGEYHYVKWWNDGLILQADPRQEYDIGETFTGS